MEKAGLKAGLEVHQQLDTHKLFCNCPSLLRQDQPLKKIERKLNPVVGETGKVDLAALYEKSKDKTYEYEAYDTNCLVELDEEPPHQINKEALEISLHIALLFNCKIFPVTQIMRKTVIDGSNTSGFQRTTLIAHDGFIETSEGKVGIETIALEEDAARIIKHEKNRSTFRLDRLGIPLVEVVTKPDLKSDEQIKEAALKIGEILRAAKVKRGLGTIRQDLNISIPGSERVEIKGFQDPKIMIKTINNEVKRQQQCLKENKCENEVRKSLPDGATEFLRPMPGAARMYPETDHPLLRISREMINHAKKTLPKLASEHRSYLKQHGLNDELIKLLVKQNKVQEFEFLLNTFENANLIAKTLTLFMTEIEAKENKSKEQISEILNIDTLESILNEVKTGKLTENDVKIVMQKIVQGKSMKEALTKGTVNLKEEVEKIIKEKPGLSEGAYMGLIMAKFKGQVSGNDLMKELKAQLS
jgi:Glu-tRNA(Gln) amidotransferase subunit E-like FAD-binding protein